MKLVQLDEIAPQGVSHDPEIMKRVLLHEDEMPHGVRLSHALFRPGQRVSHHSHADLSEVFYVISGSGTLIVDGAEHAIAAGSSFRIDPGEEHALLNTGIDDMAVLYFGLKQA
jgi:mannose-6-phosphate isomerase-like protein (cupin superfamily)